MVLTGEFIDAQKARAYGLINRIANKANLAWEVASLTEKICSKPQIAVRTDKQIFYQQPELGVSGAYQFAGDVMARNMMAEDTGEGIDAFISKRKPVWKNKV